MYEIHSDKDLDQYIVDYDGYVLLDLWAGWCRPCRVMAPTFEAAEAEFEGRVRFCRMDVDELEDLTEAFHIQGVPTFVMLKGGKEVGRIIGYHMKSKFFAEIEKLIGA